MAFCNNCGSQLKPGAKFCENCGALAEEEKTPESTGAAPVYTPPPYQPYAGAAPPTAPAGGKNFGLPAIILACALVVVLIGGIIGIVTLSGTVSDLKEENTQLVADKNQLTNQLNAANSTILSLNSDLSAANSEISELTGDLNTATGQINDLNDDLAEANSNLNAASATIANLEDENAELAADKSELAADLADAGETILTLNTIIDVMNDNYEEIVALIDTRFGWIEEDAKQFVTPDDETVAELVEWLVTPFTGDWNKAWSDMKYMLNWIRGNIEYSYDSPLPILPLDLLEGGDIEWFGEFWQYPAETIYFAHGDCEDQALLLASMIKNYGQGETFAYCIGISNGESGHMAVAMPVTDNRLVILDPTGQYYSAEWNGDVAFWDVETALQNWLNWWADDMPGAEVFVLFDNEDYFEFDGNADFLDWYLG